MKPFFVILCTLALIRGAFPAQYKRMLLSDLGLNSATAISPDGNLIAGYHLVGSTEIPVVVPSNPKTRFVVPRWTNQSSPAVAFLESGQTIVRRSEPGNPYATGIALADANGRVLEPIPSYYTGWNHITEVWDAKEIGGVIHILGSQQITEWGGPTRPFLWRRFGGYWLVQEVVDAWINETAMSMDSSGFIYGTAYDPSGTYPASYWDADLNKHTLALPGTSMGGQALGRLPNGKIIGYSRVNSVHQLVVWNTVDSVGLLSPFNLYSWRGTECSNHECLVKLVDVRHPTINDYKIYAFAETGMLGDLSTLVIGGIPSTSPWLRVVGESGAAVISTYSYPDTTFHLLTPQ